MRAWRSAQQQRFARRGRCAFSTCLASPRRSNLVTHCSSIGCSCSRPCSHRLHPQRVPSSSAAAQAHNTQQNSPTPSTSAASETTTPELCETIAAPIDVACQSRSSSSNGVQQMQLCAMDAQQLLAAYCVASPLTATHPPSVAAIRRYPLSPAAPLALDVRCCRPENRRGACYRCRARLDLFCCWRSCCTRCRRCL